MASPPLIFDRAVLAVRRQRAAVHLAEHAFLIERVAEDIAERLAAIRRRFRVALDLGAGTGAIGRRIREPAGIGTLISTDIAPACLAFCEAPCACVDEELLPFGDGSLDLVVSGLVLHHANDLPGVLAQVRRALRPDGLMLASLLGGSTLWELRAAFADAEEQTAGGASPRVAPFADVRDLGALMQRAGFALPVADSDSVTVAYPSVLHLMRDLRGMAATNVLAERSRRPLRRDTLARLAEIYARRFARPDGRITATFEIMTLTGWAPDASQQQPLRPGSARTRLADALGVPERPAGEPADGE